MLAVIAARLMHTGIEWWLATTRLSSDDGLARQARKLGLNVYRGDEHDVLSRFEEIVLLRRPKWVVRATGDNPAISFEAVPRLLECLDSLGRDDVMISDATHLRRYPIGHVPQVIGGATLLNIRGEISASGLHHLTHVTSVMHRLDRVLSLPTSIDLGEARADLRWTVDEEADLELMRILYREVKTPHNRSLARYPELVDTHDTLPNLRYINAKVTQKRMEDG